MATNINPTRTKVSAVLVGAIADLLTATPRTSVFIYNESTATLTLIAGSGGGADDYTYVVASNKSFSCSGHEASSAWRGFWSAENGQARVTEWK